MAPRREIGTALFGPMGIRRERAARAAYIAGVLFLVSGGTGAIAFVEAGWVVVNALNSGLGRVLAPLFLVVLILAGLGGVTIMLGGYVLRHHHRQAGKVLIGLGAGAGALFLIMQMIIVAAQGENPLRVVLSLTATVQGIAILLAAWAQISG